MTNQLHAEPLPVDILIRSLDLYADRTAVHLGDDALTYGQVRDDISRCAQAYASLGIGVGSKVDRPSITVYDGGATYREWEFIWNPAKDPITIGGAGPGAQIGTPITPGIPGSTPPGGQPPPPPPRQPQN